MFEFNMAQTANAVESTGKKRLDPRIYNATFKGITKNVIESHDGRSFNVMTLNLEIEDYGPFTHNFFEPGEDGNVRKDGLYGPNASKVDHLLISIRQILEALDPDIVKGIDAGTTKIGGSFSKVVKTIQQLTDEYIGDEVEIKMVPNNNGYCDLPAFPAKLTKNGNLAIATRFIGHDLAMTASEQKKIDAAKNAKPTNMATASKKSTTDLLGDIATEVKADDEVEDLPEF